MSERSARKKTDAELIADSGLFDAQWYVQAYPDVAAWPGLPERHFLLHGLAIGRDPGPEFSSAFYASAYPDAAGIPPLLHYLRVGMAQKRYRTVFHARRPLGLARRAARRMSYKIFVAGFETEALREAEAMVRDHHSIFMRSAMAMTLASWAIWRAGPEIAVPVSGEETPEQDEPSLQTRDLARRALGWLGGMSTGWLAPEEMAARDLLTVLALIGDRRIRQARLHVEAAAAAGRPTAELDLALTLSQRSGGVRRSLLARAFGGLGLAPPEFPARSGAPDLADRLRFVTAAAPRAPAGPAISVVVAAEEATDPAAILRTLRAVQASEGVMGEIVLAGPEATLPKPSKVPKGPFAIRRIETDGSAAAAANRGRRAATGAFAAILAAGDVVHPARLRRQADALLLSPEALAVTAPAIWLAPDLQARRWFTGAGGGQDVPGPDTERAGEGVSLFHQDPESVLVRRAEAEAVLGDRDLPEGGAAEYLARARAAGGPGAVLHLADGPPVLRFETGPAGHAAPLPRGAALDYREAGAHHHAQVLKDMAAAPLRYDLGAGRPFPAPARLSGRAGTGFYDVIIASDFRLIGGSTQSNASEIRAQRQAGLRTGLVQMYRYDFHRDPWRPMLPEIRNEVHAGQVAGGQESLVDVLAEGDEVSCDLLILRYPPVLRYSQTIVPRIAAGSMKVIVNQPPRSDYSDDSVVRYDLIEADRTAREMFGTAPVWHPIGPLVRQAMITHHGTDLQQIELSSEDWVNIIDLADWARRPRGPAPGRTPRIGRHSRGHAHKWPATAEDILAAYPASGPFEVHVLGGAEPAAKILGAVPENWTVHDFGARSPRRFLAELDFWVYFAHPDWIESFGRTIIEAMAVGMPVLLPEVYRPLFGEHAIYCTPAEVQGIVRDLWADAGAYHARVGAAQDFVRRRFSYETHITRLAAAGVSVGTVPPAPSGTRPDQARAEQRQASGAPAVPAKEGRRPAAGSTTVPGTAQLVLGDISAVRRGLKDSAETLDHLPRRDYPGPDALGDEPAIYAATHEGWRYDLLFSPKAGADRLFVFFSGNAMRKKYNPPVFQRWKWAPAMPGHCLYISDPTILLDDALGLAWYCGTPDHDPQDRIAALIREIAMAQGVAPEGITTYGSSGGGFAALRILPALPGASAIAINPQIDVTRYQTKNVEQYTGIAIGTRDRAEALARMPRLSLLNRTEALAGRRIAYLQNTLDLHHMSAHYRLFREEMQRLGSRTFHPVLFTAEGGHGAAETPEAMVKAFDALFGS
ncbi:glycosyltransferase [Wenxinia marina]|uniref:Glycosyltransferase n=1 Tax=Wenxinia marina DSM 24838 TaxID=1123501 RepID=A0A0D0QGP4_9RHOB|nr:glycosyltransferase family 1 protein [Wenxinia marina]KIQ71437.1 hypothetical protein Wenmar_04085 [Wenxinia marina DSM 24838]GGL78985.1 hypothetical protein GCM10011392_36870 [Wenxinia marina]